MAAALGLRPALAPARSPHSNGLSGAFVKTLRRDCAKLAVLPDAEAAMALPPAWFEDDDTVRPNSGLRVLSPREFLAQGT